MSKLYDIYSSLKKQETSENVLYLFKSGVFFIFIDNDARTASMLLNLKLTALNDKIVKCGFPINSLEKYTNILKIHNYSYKIIDITEKNSYHPSDYQVNKLLLDISNIDTDNLSIKEAYSFIDELKIKAKSILGGN